MKTIKCTQRLPCQLNLKHNVGIHNDAKRGQRDKIYTLRGTGQMLKLREKGAFTNVTVRVGMNMASTRILGAVFQRFLGV